MRRGMSVAAMAVCIAVVGACQTGGGGASGPWEGANKPPCTADVVLPTGPVPTRTPPTIIGASVTDLQLETPGFDADFHRVSADGSKLLLRTEDQNAVPGGFPGDVAWVVRDRTTGSNTLVHSRLEARGDVYPETARFLPDGSVALAEFGYWLPEPPDSTSDNTFLSQIFRWDINTHDYTPLSLGPDGKPIAVLPPGVAVTGGLPVYPAHGPREHRVSADGRYVFFLNRVPLGADDPPGPYAATPGGSLKDLFRRDTVTGEIVKINVGNHPELGPLENGGTRDVWKYEVSADGNFVVFQTPATGGLAETGFCQFGDLLFLRDIEAGTTTLVSHDDAAGVQRYGSGAQISADGRFVTYAISQYNSYNHVGGPAPGFAHLPGVKAVIWDRLTDTTDWILPKQDGTPTPSSGVVSMSADANLFLYVTTDDGATAGGVIPGDGDGKPETVLFDRAANTIRKVSQLPDGTHLSWTDMYPTEMSDDGSRLFFRSPQALLPGDTNVDPDLYSMALN